MIENRMVTPYADDDAGKVPESSLSDNGLCVNYKHLFLSDHAGNMADMAIKGRSTRGERNHFSRITAQQAMLIKRDQRKQIDIAADFSVSQQLVSAIKRGIAWSHISLTDTKSGAN